MKIAGISIWIFLLGGVVIAGSVALLVPSSATSIRGVPSTAPLPTASSSKEPEAVPDLAQLERLARRYLYASQAYELTSGIDATARESLRDALTPGAAALEEMNYKKSQARVEQDRQALVDARAALGQEEERIRSSGLEWAEASYLDAIDAYASEARQKRREYDQLRMRRLSSRDAHAAWLAFLKVSLDQIKSGDY